MGVKEPSRCRIGCKNPKAQDWHLLCPACWAELPKILQDDVWREYKKQKGSDAHLTAVRAVYRYFHIQEGKA